MFFDGLLASYPPAIGPPLLDEFLEILKGSVYEFFDDLQRNTLVPDKPSIHPYIRNLDPIALDLIFNLMTKRKNVLRRTYYVSDLYNYYGCLLMFDTIIAVGERILQFGRKSLYKQYSTNIKLQIADIIFLKERMVNKFTEDNSTDINNVNVNSILMYERITRVSSFDQFLREAPDKQCAICLEKDISEEDFSVLEYCRHIFCTPCIWGWIEARYVQYLSYIF